MQYFGLSQQSSPTFIHFDAPQIVTCLDDDDDVLKPEYSKVFGRDELTEGRQREYGVI